LAEKQRVFTPQILRFESLPSTNLEAATRAIAGAAEGVCIVAREQTAGRGRLQRNWLSPKDAGLYFSIIVRPQFEQRFWPLLTLMSAVAVHDALLDACGLVTDIKWPNDVLVGDRKLCGILAETVETPLGRAVVIGVGINLTTNSFPAELETVAISVASVTSQAPAVEVVLEALVRALGLRYEVLNQVDGPAETIREWCARSSYCEGKLISVTETNDILVGTTRGLERDGALRVETDSGELRIIRAGDVMAIRTVPA
jgi:BirA family biotin operon repressor/biotin-[acetyl-CoA-carboxylase] ligase